QSGRMCYKDMHYLTVKVTEHFWTPVARQINGMNAFWHSPGLIFWRITIFYIPVASLGLLDIFLKS
ncbi:hypothetical protein J5I95_24495, partial [Candidatus Poribacteria bacterium]|nr:hypothetical protein [Candidatus Poribacteria bacterium]